MRWASTSPTYWCLRSSSGATLKRVALLDAVENRLADVFLQLPSRRQRERARKRVRLRQRLRIVNRELDIHMSEVWTAIALSEVHLIAVRLARRVEPGL